MLYHKPKENPQLEKVGVVRKRREGEKVQTEHEKSSPFSMEATRLEERCRG